MEIKTSDVKNTQGKIYKNFQIVVFRIGEEEYGLHIDQIKEVVITPVITRMPETSSFLKGVANIRGNVIAIIDLDEKFGYGSQLQNGKKSYTLVIESEDFKMGVRVKDVPNTISISENDVENSGFVLDNGQEQSYIKGIVKLPNRLIIMIDIFKVINEKDIHSMYKKEGQST
jgi:purine-binding chemotaxis protein CheW